MHQLREDFRKLAFDMFIHYNMATAHSRNSNFLLNVGPDRDGNIVESSIKTLVEIGKLNFRRHSYEQ